MQGKNTGVFCVTIRHTHTHTHTHTPPKQSHYTLAKITFTLIPFAQVHTHTHTHTHIYKQTVGNMHRKSTHKSYVKGRDEDRCKQKGTKT